MKLEYFFNKNNKIALGFSGGVDSSYLLYAAVKYNVDIRAYYVRTQFQPEFEYNDAMRIARNIGAEVTVIEYDILSDSNITQNPADRCYYCKRRIFSAICQRAAEDGYTTIIDGTNASDDAGDRPGMRALGELNVISPLKECGLTKADIRKLSEEAGLFTWNKAAYSCLATRINMGNEITADKLKRIENSEMVLFKLGFDDFRVRMYNDSARLEFTDRDIEKAFKARDEIVGELSPYFEYITLDMKGRKSNG